MGKISLLFIAAIVLSGPVYSQTDLGNLSTNPYSPSSTSNPYGAGSQYNPNSITNPNGQYGSPYSNKSATNPYATAPCVRLVVASKFYLNFGGSNGITSFGSIY